MCRTGGRRCDAKWDDAHRERYNARRRITRNGEKAAIAQANGDERQVAYYESLVRSATEVERALDASIKAHEADSARTEEAGDLSYQGGHTAPRDDGYSKPITRLTDGFFGDDVYEHPDWYGTADDETMGQLRNVRDDPSATVTIYRAVPGGHEEINQGDWVTLSRQYAEEHSYDLEGEDADGVIVSMEVPSSQVFTDGNDLAEYGYAGPSTPLGGDGREAVTSPSTSGDGERARCGECGQFVGSSHSCPGAAFRESAIRDEDGNLAVLHHGSATDFQEWDPEFTGTGNDSWGSGFYFTHSESLAHGYGEHVKSVVVNIQNPIHVNGLDDATLDHVFFDAKQSASILRRHPDIYRQPNDEDEMNPLGDYSPEFWDKDEWSEEEIDSMISKVSEEHFDDVPWSHLENVFSGGQTDQFRRGVRDATGHDGVVVDFKEDGRHTIAWFPEQVHEVSSTSNGGNTPNGGDEGNGDNSSERGDTSDTSTASAASAPASDDSDGGHERCPQCGRWAGSNHDCPQQRTHENLREISAEWREGWSGQEEEAFDTYGGIEHYDINAKLRSGAPLTVREARVVRDLDSALARAPRTTEEQTLYRAFGLASSRGDAPVDKWVDEHFPQGEVTSFDSYTSVTPDNSVAEYFSEANSEYTEGGVLMEIKTRQGGYTGDSAESEVLLRRGSRFEVVSNDEAVEMNGKKFRKVVLQEKASRFGSGPAPEHPLSSHASSPMKVSYIRNPTSLGKNAAADHDFGQDVEPSGRYISESWGVVPDGWESGDVRFEKPLHLEFGQSGLYSEDDNWKRRLSGFYEGKTGKELSDAVRADGYDGIVTHDKRGVSEIVDLTSVR